LRFEKGKVDKFCPLNVNSLIPARASEKAVQIGYNEPQTRSPVKISILLISLFVGVSAQAGAAKEIFKSGTTVELQKGEEPYYVKTTRGVTYTFSNVLKILADEKVIGKNGEIGQVQKSEIFSRRTDLCMTVYNRNFCVGEKATPSKGDSSVALQIVGLQAEPEGFMSRKTKILVKLGNQYAVVTSEFIDPM
jgi:hypothetical protein